MATAPAMIPAHCVEAGPGATCSRAVLSDGSPRAPPGVGWASALEARVSGSRSGRQRLSAGVCVVLRISPPSRFKSPDEGGGAFSSSGGSRARAAFSGHSTLRVCASGTRGYPRRRVRARVRRAPREGRPDVLRPEREPPKNGEAPTGPPTCVSPVTCSLAGMSSKRLGASSSSSPARAASCGRFAACGV